MQRTRDSVLFLNWKDITNPSSGGAEILTDALASHMAKTHSVAYFTSAYPGCKREETCHGYRIIRRGNVYTVILHAFWYWHRNRTALRQYSYIIDQVHGIPFFSVLYKKHPPIITIVHEVAGILWKNLLPAPIWKIGILAEYIWTYLYRKYIFIAVSNSTKTELERLGIPHSNIHIVENFLPFLPPNKIEKSNIPTLLILGRIAPVKKIEDAIAAYRIAKKSIPNLRLNLVGKGENKYRAYKKKILANIAYDPHITFHENCTEEEKRKYLESAHLLILTSQKEGYGIVILEAAAYGTPTIGYRVPGIQDAVIHNRTGMLVEYRNLLALANEIYSSFRQTRTYEDIQQKAIAHAKAHTKEKTIAAFEKNIQALYPHYE